MSELGPLPTARSRAEISVARRKMFRRLFSYMVGNRGAYSLGVVTTLMYTGAFVLVPLLVGRAIEAVEQDLGAAEVARRCGWLAAVTLVRSGLRFVSRTQIFNAGRQIEYEIRNDLFEHLQAQPQSFFFRWRTGDLMSRCVNDLTSVRLLLGPGLLSVLQTPFLFIATLGVMFTMNSTLTWFVLLPYPLFILISRAFGRAMHGTNLAVQVGLADLSNRLQETVSGIAVVKAYAMEDTTRRRFAAATQELYERQLHLVRVNGAMPAVTGLLPMIGLWTVFTFGGSEIVGGQMTLAQFFTFTMYIWELTFPTFILGWVFALVQRGTAAMERIDEILGTAPTIADRPGAQAGGRLRGEIEFHDLTFVYPGAEREPALRDVSLRVPAGSVLGVVGPVGAGKTTLASLIPRLFEVEDGKVTIDGVDVNDLPISRLRSSIAVVPQDAFLFSMSLADNVAYGLPQTERDTVRLAARRAQLDKDVEDLPQGYETVVGERGVMLSGGQRQRTALARALATDPSILILDDTLSAVDAETEAAIQLELARVFEGRTVIVVASRVSTVRGADEIVVLDEGRVVERGTHQALSRAGGLYSRLSREQESDGAEEAAAAAAVGGGS